ncbi:hypothetical protein M9434_006606 [Picochlorum sp. BPE23]|nr:hypothetical protein M9434_006606 [Picochlorum sp. BPE23]KAI8109259.1 hypothetical protein M9435_005671 [Picochlorum sp. BPE23]|eukprot:jgi/Picre1/35872/NNA_003331.t1
MPVVELKVAMACGGCSGAVERVLNNTAGVKSVKTDLESQKVTVETDDGLSAEAVKDIVAKTGKATEFWS